MKLAAVVSFHNSSANGSKCYKGLWDGKDLLRSWERNTQGRVQDGAFSTQVVVKQCSNMYFTDMKECWLKSPCTTSHIVWSDNQKKKKRREILTNTTSIGLSKYQTYKYLKVSKKQNKKTFIYYCRCFLTTTNSIVCWHIDCEWRSKWLTLTFKTQKHSSVIPGKLNRSNLPWQFT